jgi:hypothetical protein
MVGVNSLTNTASNSALSLLAANQPASSTTTGSGKSGQPSSVAATSSNTVSNATSAAITTLTAQPSTANTSDTSNESLAQIAADASATLNANLASMAAAGNPMDWTHATQADWNTAFAGLDQTSLYAIASNAGGLSTSDEQQAAYALMVQPLQQAMGLNDPTTFIADPAAGYAAGMTYMNSFSPEVQNSPWWQLNMASLQVGYQDTSTQENPGETPANVVSSNPVVELLTNIMLQAQGTSFSTLQGNGSFITDLTSIPLFEQHSAELEQATAQLNAQNSANGTTV